MHDVTRTSAVAAAGEAGAVGPRAARVAGVLAAVTVVLLLTGLLLGVVPGVPGAPVGAAAQQPYGPVVLDVTVDEGTDRDRLALRVTGLRPNSSIVAVASGGLRVTGIADGAGVAVLTVELPTVVDVEVRGIAADGLPLVLLETVAFPRFEGDATNGVVPAAGPSGALLGLSWALAVIGLAVGAVSTVRLRSLRASLAAAPALHADPQADPQAGPSSPSPSGEGDPG